MDELAFYSSWGIYIVLIFICYCWHLNNTNNKPCLNGLLCAFVLLGTFAYITADYPSYMEFVHEAVHYKEYLFTHIEPFYIRLANVLDGDYLLFRFIIMSCTFILLCQLYKRLKAYNISVLFFYSVFCLHTNISGRQAFANLLFLLGAWFLYLAKFRVYKYVFPMILIIASLFLHKSNILFVPLLLMFHFKVRKKMMFLVAIGLAIFLFGADFLLEYVLNFSYDNEVAGRYYLTAEGRFVDRNIWWRILTIMQDISVLSILIVESLVLFKYQIDDSFNFVYRMIFGSFVLALFALCLPIESDVVFRRVLAFTKLLMVIPLPILLHRSVLMRKFVMFLTIIYFIGSNIFILGVGRSFLK